MINYSVDTPEREVIYSALALLSAITVSFLRSFRDGQLYQFTAPSALMIFVLLISIYDSFIWRIASRLGISAIPDLNGNWEGQLEKNNGDAFLVSLHVSQSWRKIQASLDTSSTVGSLQICGMSISDKNRPVVKWIYNLRPRYFALEEGYNPSGEGVNEFRVLNLNSEQRLDGAYC
ncbi:MAG: hypothetical protein F6K47_09670 [Symploca sp. SIO2E6]|nr:hypothetical protein [Symploca sp. SIO2E6]